MLLTLKLCLVPSFLLLISLAGRRWGPEVAGWLAGMPLLTGPILFLLALEMGPAFAAASATVSLSAVLGAVVFIVVYARVCVHRPPPSALAAGLLAWCCTALLLPRLPLNNATALAIALISLLIAPRLMPRLALNKLSAPLPRWELPLRMLAGAVVTLTVTALAAVLGPAWTGMFAVFPVLAIVLAVFSHYASGPAFATILLRSMLFGLYAFTSFCLAIALLLPRQGVATSFLAACAIALMVQGLLRLRLYRL